VLKELATHATNHLHRKELNMRISAGRAELAGIDGTERLGYGGLPSDPSSDGGTHAMMEDGFDAEPPVQANIFVDILIGKAVEFLIDKGMEAVKEGVEAAKGALKAAGEVAVKVAENAGRGAGAPPGVAAPSSK
jgi:hypothetical protein